MVDRFLVLKAFVTGLRYSIVLHSISSHRAKQTVLQREFDGSVAISNCHCGSFPAENGPSQKISIRLQEGVSWK